MSPPSRFWRGEPSLFVVTETGETIHIVDPEDPSTTRCGRPAGRQADADDVLWYRVCGNCRRDR